MGLTLTAAPQLVSSALQLSQPQFGATLYVLPHKGTKRIESSESIMCLPNSAPLAYSFLYENQEALPVSSHEVAVSSFLILNIDVEEWPRLPSHDFLICEL